MSGDSGANSCDSCVVFGKVQKTAERAAVKGQKMLGKGYVSAIDAILFQKGLKLSLNQSGVVLYH